MKHLPHLGFIPEVPDDEISLRRKCILWSVLIRWVPIIFMVVVLLVFLAIGASVGWLPILGWQAGFVITVYSCFLVVLILLVLVAGALIGVVMGLLNYHLVWESTKMFDDPAAKKIVKIMTVLCLCIPYLQLVFEFGGYLSLIFLKYQIESKK